MMLIAAVSVLCQSGAGSPVLGAGASPEFLKACVGVEQRLHDRDFGGAAALAAMLPKSTVTVSWNDSAVGQTDRGAFRDARDRVFAAWKKAVPTLQFKLADHGDIGFEFERNAPTDDRHLPTAATDERMWSPGQTSLLTKIALMRGLPAESTSEDDVYNEIAYSTCVYFGLRQGRYIGTFSARTDFAVNRESTLMQDEIRDVTDNIAASDVLRRACADHTELVPANPKVELVRVQDAPPLVTQGAHVPLEFRISNKGNAPLKMRLQPECGCIGVVYDPDLAPGKEASVKVTIDTSQLAGKIQKHVFIYSNDPDSTGTEVPLSVEVTPRYRILAPDGFNMVLDDQHKSAQLFLTFPDEKTQLTSAKLVGGKGRVTFERWSGMIAHPEMAQAPSERHGYKINIEFDPDMPTGLYYVNVQGTTNAADLPIVFRTISVQKGVVALPAQVYLGEVGHTPRAATFLLTCRGKTFAIRKIDCDNPHLSATYKPFPGGYKVSVMYDGAATGNIDAKIIVHTDDPSQPEVTIPVLAYTAKG